MISRTSFLKKVIVPQTKQNYKVSRKLGSMKYSSKASLSTFKENFSNLLKENRFSEAEKAIAQYEKLSGDVKEFTETEFFRGLYAVTKAFADKGNIDSVELEQYFSTFQDSLLASQLESRGVVKPLKIAVTGAAGAIGYAALFRIASGHLLGNNVPVELHLLELPDSLGRLQGVVMELNDCAFPLLKGVKTFSDAEKAFEDVDVALLIGAQPRTKGMERSDLLKKNGDIFTVQGRALNKSAKKTVKVVVVGNPANTNCLIASHSAPSIPKENFSAMTKLDHTRGLSQLSSKLNCIVRDIEQFAIWGNHSSTQFPSIEHALVRGVPVRKLLSDKSFNLDPELWINDEFIPTVQNRGAEIIKVRGASSAASAASACLDHIREWMNGSNGQWTSMGISSNGEYGITKGLFFSYPVITSNGNFKVVEGLEFDPKSQERIDKTHKELLQERDAVASLLK